VTQAFLHGTAIVVAIKGQSIRLGVGTLLWPGAAPSITIPPGRSHTGAGGQSPGPPTRFVGRASTIELVRKRLDEHRLLSLVGPGGCGKAAPAMEVVSRISGPEDRVAFVDF
jgi:hypothetical protein